MKKNYLRKSLTFSEAKDVSGKEVIINSENYYKIENVDAMRPFFMSIVSPYNHWLFISSNGSLSGGRKDSNNALFPYYTDDKITELQEITGNKTIFKIFNKNEISIWEPFSLRNYGLYDIERNLYKNLKGNKVIFEETNKSIGLTYKYQWSTCDEFGFVKKSSINNHSGDITKIELVDGIQNILPWGVDEALQNSNSNLVDAYKRNELDESSKIGIYSLSAIIVDKAEPSEALKANISWSNGFDECKILISSLQLDNFRKDIELFQENDVKAEKGAYFINSQISLNENETKEWYIVSDVNKSSSEVLELKKIISEEKNTIAKINQCIEKASDDLLKLVGASDGLQTSQRRLRNIRHFSNTLFNIMRGGIFDNHYDIEKLDFSNYIKRSNKKVFSKKKDLINNLPDIFDIKKIRFLCENDDDKNFIRLCYEYLPLKFSRRHGDPSRPWNKFSINTRNEIDNSKILDYQGNWRDIFQNWEALAYSYPEFIEGMIFKFLNSTTFDGYNPYRVTKYGFDWETLEADNPWSYIGYWGDHQIIYLLKFLEFIENYYPGKIKKYLDHDFFVYANVPYKIKSHDEILKDPKNTIDFDFENEEKILRRRERFGIDGALLRDENYFIIKVNFIEKILATSLAKISNFIPEAGIWMNTQRPEWNDANNALVGNGVSMVTLYYLRRFLGYFKDIIEKYSLSEYDLSSELKDYFDQIYSSLINNENLLAGNINDHERKLIMDQLGVAASSYRNTIYKNGFSGDKSLISKKEILEFINITIRFLNHSIKSNKRSDGLYHAYNLITIHDTEVEISYLPEMLEGQVAILSSGALSTNENLEVLNNLRKSKLFRPDQYSYLLYPNKNLPGFLEKNNIHEKDVLGSKFLTSLVEEGNKQIIVKDCNGGYHFNGLFNNINSLIDEIKKLPEKYSDLVKKERDYIYNLFEKVFDHKSFTGRSGTFYGYEGLGSIYWHMVSKLQLAVYEVTSRALKSKDDKKIIGKLFDHYFEINEGVGVNKSPDLYGAFPTDPYSHTPFGRGAQQPGMTGQVKEDIISRFGELGLRVFDGKISFDPSILRRDEFNLTESVFKYVDYNSKIRFMNLNKNTLAFSVCQVPVIYHLSKSEEIEITFVNGDSKRISGNEIDEINSKKIFERTNEIEKIDVFVVKNI
ncbi:MAG: hypothetical protein ACJ0O5_01950 [Flavobacteriaceae bacterium]